jgi:hypothetical protein
LGDGHDPALGQWRPSTLAPGQALHSVGAGAQGPWESAAEQRDPRLFLSARTAQDRWSLPSTHWQGNMESFRAARDHWRGGGEAAGRGGRGGGLSAAGRAEGQGVRGARAAARREVTAHRAHSTQDALAALYRPPKRAGARALAAVVGQERGRRQPLPPRGDGTAGVGGRGSSRRWRAPDPSSILPPPWAAPPAREGEMNSGLAAVSARLEWLEREHDRTRAARSGPSPVGEHLGKLEEEMGTFPPMSTIDALAEAQLRDGFVDARIAEEKLANKVALARTVTGFALKSRLRGT